MKLHSVGIDLGKTVFDLIGLDQSGEVVVCKKFSRLQLLRFTANVQVDLIGMEACGGSQSLGRALREQGHQVRLIPAQYVGRPLGVLLQGKLRDCLENDSADRGCGHMRDTGPGCWLQTRPDSSK